MFFFFKFANLRIKNQVFGQATEAGDFLRNLPFDGILGLGFPEANGVLGPFNQMVAERILDQNLFSVYFTRCKKFFLKINFNNEFFDIL